MNKQPITYHVEINPKGKGKDSTPKKLGRPPKYKPPVTESPNLIFSTEESSKIELTESQEKIQACGKRFIFVRAGRRFGKTTYMQKWLKDNAYAKPNSNWWYVAPTFKMAKSLMLLPILNAIPKEDIKSTNKQDGDIYLKNGSLIGIRGSDRPDNLRGPREGLDGVGMEEFSFHKEGVWPLIIRPQLADKKGKALFIGTPSMKRGMEYRELDEYALSGKDKEWQHFHFKIFDNPHIDKDEIETIKASTTESAWQQEYLAEFVMEEGPVYYDFKEGEHREFVNVKYPNVLTRPCVVGMDWGLADDTGIVWVHVLESGELAVTKEHSQNNWTVGRHVEVMKPENTRRNAIKAFVLDSTAFRRDGDGTSSVAHEFRKEGIPVQPADRSLDISIGVMKKFITGTGERTWLHIDKSCQKLIQAIKHWQHGQHEPDIASALRFAIFYIYRNKLSTLVNLESLSAANVFKGQVDKTQGVKEKPVLRLDIEGRSKSLMWGGNSEWDRENGAWA